MFMKLFEINDYNVLALLNLPPPSDTTPTKKNMVIRDNDTRWNSVYLMIHRAFKRRAQIDGFIRNCETLSPDKRVPQEDKLTEGNWAIITEIHNFFKPFYDLTIYMESRAPNAINGSIWETLPLYSAIEKHLKFIKIKYVYAVRPSAFLTVHSMIFNSYSYIFDQVVLV
jgi:hypothetical protein